MPSTAVQAAQFPLERVVEVVRAVLRRKSGRSLRADDRHPENVDALELCQDVIARLWERHATFGGTAGAWKDAEAFAATVAHNAWSDHLRQKHPRRASLRNRLRNRLRYFMTHQPRYAVWDSARGETMAGWKSWAVSGAAAADATRWQGLQEGRERLPRGSLPAGRCELEYHNMADPKMLQRIFGTHACFVFDPQDDRNRPLPDRHGPVLAHWPIYPEELRRLFTRAFTQGLFDPHGRVQETEWRRALRRLLDSVLPCPHCGAQNFYDPHRLSGGMRSFPCWGCGKPLPSAPARMGIRLRGSRAAEPPAHVVVLADGAKLYPHHLGLVVDAGAHRPCANVDGGAEPVLHNGSRLAWRASGPHDGEPVEVAPGGAVALCTGLRIDFGRTAGEIKI